MRRGRFTADVFAKQKQRLLSKRKFKCLVPAKLREGKFLESHLHRGNGNLRECFLEDSLNKLLVRLAL